MRGAVRGPPQLPPHTAHSFPPPPFVLPPFTFGKTSTKCQLSAYPFHHFPPSPEGVGGPYQDPLPPPTAAPSPPIHRPSAHIPPNPSSTFRPPHVLHTSLCGPTSGLTHRNAWCASSIHNHPFPLQRPICTSMGDGGCPCALATSQKRGPETNCTVQEYGRRER